MIHRVGQRRPNAALPLPPEPLELDACYRYCEAMARARHHNFPVASFFVPAHLRRHIWAVYAFARTADDFADEPAFEGRRAVELDRWEERLRSCYHGEAPDHPVFVALADTARRFELPITELQSLIDGFRTDLEVRRYATMRELRSYTALAAEPVGRLVLYLGGYTDPVLHGYADDLSTGLSLAKLWQDIPADLARGRVYVPGEDLRHFGVRPEDLGSGQSNRAIDSLIRYQVARTRALFARARPLVEAVGPDMAIEMALMWLGGMQILDKIDSLGGRILERRPRLNALDKARVVSKAVAWRGSSIARRWS